MCVCERVKLAVGVLEGMSVPCPMFLLSSDYSCHITCKLLRFMSRVNFTFPQ